jgi:molybdopterin-guanine dinucleotide biosynthesis protein A
MRRALRDVAIIAKADSELPSLSGVTVWIEPDAPRHPVVGITEALGMGGGRPVLVCGVDLPFVTPAVISRIAQTRPGAACAVVACHQGAMQPLLACYQPAATERLMRAGSERPLRDAVASLDPVLLEIEDADVLFNVNTPDDLLQAAAMLDRDQPKVKS